MSCFLKNFIFLIFYCCIDEFISLLILELTSDNVKIMRSYATLAWKCHIQKSLFHFSLKNDILVAFAVAL